MLQLDRLIGPIGSPPPPRAAGESVGTPSGAAAWVPHRRVATLPGGKRSSHLVILPTLNEEEGIRATLAELRGPLGGSDGVHPPVLVIDGGSTDGTLAVARKYGCEILRQRGRGKGAAVRDGLQWAVDHGVESVAVLDADATYPADRIPALFRLLDDGFDVVIGVRRPDDPSPMTARNVVHRAGNGLLGFCAAVFSRGPIIDVCSGFWGLKTAWVAPLALESTGFEIESELFMKSFRRGLRVCQIPIAYRKRLGTAKLHAIRDGARILLSIIRHSGLSPVHAPHPDGDRWNSARPRPLAFGSLGSTIPALTAILLTLNPERVVVASSPKRRREAVGLALGLPPGTHEVRLDISKGEPWSGSGPDASVPPAIPNSSDGSDRPMIVTLPDATADLPDPGRVVVTIPGTPWVLAVGPTTLVENSPYARSGAQRFYEPVEPWPLSLPPSPWAILGAVLDSSWRRKERAVLGANANAVGATIGPLPSVVPGSDRWAPEPVGVPMPSTHSGVPRG